MIHILVVEDDIKINHIVCTYLNNNGYNAIGCKTAMEAFDKMLDNVIDIIISDIMMPGMDGYEFAEIVRKQSKNTPIIFMTARDDISSKKKGFSIGIDDYMVKPIELDELIMRIEALLRRANIASERKITVGLLTLKADENMAYLSGEELPLTVREFAILFKLLSYPKRTFTRTQLMDEFWGMESESTPRTVDVSITKLRSKMEECTDIEIVTVRSLGYKVVIKA
jgi:two-component system OmpR family response regulator